MRAISVVEPQMEEFYHAPFNAALLHAVALAYPDKPVSFRAFPSHAAVVRSILNQNAPGLAARILWRTEPAPRPRTTSARWLQSRRSIHELLRSGERILYTSISRMSLMQLKQAMRASHQVRAVLHGDLDQIAKPATQLSPKSLFTLERVLLRPHPPGLRFLLLGTSILQNIPGRFHAAFTNAATIDHPYHFFPLEPSTATEPVFGIFGNTGDGELLHQVVSRVKTVNPNVRFRLVGFLSNPAVVKRLSPLVEDATHLPISRDLFIARARRITHALWLAPPDSFRLRASGTFLDALSYAKPLIYTANPYIDPHYAQEPDIGIRCETAAEVPNAILRVAASASPVDPTTLAAIKRLRHRFTPERLARELPGALA